MTNSRPAGYKICTNKNNKIKGEIIMANFRLNTLENINSALAALKITKM